MEELQPEYDHMMPTLEKFEKVMKEIDLRINDTVIVFDESHYFITASRVSWMLRAFGFKHVLVLDSKISPETKEIMRIYEKKSFQSRPASLQPSDDYGFTLNTS